MKRENIIRLLIAIIFLTIGILIITGYELYGQKIKILSIPEPNSREEILSRCSNLDLEKTCTCLRDNIVTFYKYTPTTEDYYDLDNLKLKGGDCLNWAMFYSDLGEDLGFYTSTIMIKSSEERNHAFTILSNEDGYCLLDLTRMEFRENAKIM
jgi:hypothetical protein